MPEISVIIPCLNGAETLAEALDSLVAQRWDRPWEIVFADNGSTDASVAIFTGHAARHPEVAMRLVDAAARRGQSNALNIAIRAAAGRSLIFCDADDTVAPGWLAAMGAALERHDFVACRFNLEALNPDWALAERQHPQVERLSILPFEPFCPVAGGATLGFHRELFEVVGDFDPAFSTHLDTDFCIRASLRGFELSLVPDAIYNYRFRDSPEAIYRQAYAYARSEALLRRRYAATAPLLAPAPWIELSMRTARLSAGWLKHRLLGRRRSLLDRARFNRGYGTALGDFAGALAYRVAPRSRRRSRQAQAAQAAAEPAHQPLLMTEVSVIIACLNGAATLAETLDSLTAQRWDRPWEIVFADNGSTDASVAIFEEHAARHPEVAMRFVDAAAKPGKSNALNLAIRAAAGRSILFCDADDTVAPGWLAAMGRALETHDFVAARFNSHRLNPDWARAARDTGQIERLTPLPFEPWCAVAGGGTLGLHREVFEAVGGFDPAFTAVEDTDFCIRAYREGYELRLVPDAVYNYRFRDSPAAIYRQAYVYARSEALLRRQYVTDAAFLAPGPWLRLATRTARLSAGWLKHRLLGRGGPVARAERSRKLGKAIGDLAGSLAYRVPPRDPGGRSAAAPSLSARLFGRFNRTTVAVRTDAKLIALTFDDGPDPDGTPRLLDALARHGAKATFFMIGARAARNPELVARIAAEGHEIGNHSWDHPSLPELSPAAVAAQLERTRAALAPHGRTLMRPPYGHQDLGTQRVLRRLGYRAVCWSVNGEDWLGHDPETIATAILSRVRPGSIVLLHDSLYSYEDAAFRDRGPTIAAVERIIERLPGWRFVTVSELLAHGAAHERFWQARPERSYMATLKTAEPA